MTPPTIRSLLAAKRKTALRARARCLGCTVQSRRNGWIELVARPYDGTGHEIHVPCLTLDMLEDRIVVLERRVADQGKMCAFDVLRGSPKKELDNGVEVH